MPKFLVIAMLLALAGACAKSKTQTPARYYKVDMHTHFGPRGAQRMVGLMDELGIDVVVNLSGGSPGRGLEQQLAVANRFPGRIIVFANLDWTQPRRGPGWGQRMAADLERSKAAGARGLKIPKGLGIGFPDWQGKLIAVDDPQLDVVFEKAGELGLPVAIHTGDPVAFWQPSTEDNERYAELSAHPGWSFYGAKLPSWEELFAAFERRVARHPKTIIIGVHFGNAPEYPERVAKMLAKYPNLYIDTAARVPEIGRHPPLAMQMLFTAYADRILFGTDFGVGSRPEDMMLGSTGDTPPTRADLDHFFASTWRYFETTDEQFAHPTPIQGAWKIDGVGLAPRVLRKVYGENAARLLGINRK